MPYVNITIASGRSSDQKKKLAVSVTEAVATSLDVDPANIWVRIDECERDNFAMGGRLLSEKK